MFTGALGTAELTVNGAMMICGTNPLFSASNLAVPVINYTSSNVAIPDLSDVGRTITGIKVHKWTAQ